MRHILLALTLLAAPAAPALAQAGGASIDQRLNRVERELRAVQRKVFPGGAGMTVEPEIAPPPTSATPSGVPATSALADMTARLDTLEAQLRTLTGQAEENGHRLNQLEQSLANFRAATESRLNAAEGPASTGGNMTSGASETPAAASSSSSGNPGEEAYLTGFRLWEARKYDEAQAVLEGMIKKYPKHPRTSYAQNLLGRAYLDGGKPATAAKVLLANYENNRNGDRAQDSLFYLGQALVQLKKLPEACRVYDELQDVYGAKLRSALKQQLPKARTAARCG